MNDLGGFSISSSTSTTMLIIFAIYTVIIVGFGYYVKKQSVVGTGDKLASFLTGGGGLGAFSIAMIAATNSMAGGTMLGAPGLTYAVGLVTGIVFFPGFLTGAFGLGSVGRKVAILKNRTGSVSFIQLLKLRFNSKVFSSAMAITGSAFLVFFAVGQISLGAKAFAAVTGTGQYYLGLLITIVITMIYASSGGVKSLAKVAVVQGVVMLISVVTIAVVLLTRNVAVHGSLDAAIRTAAETRPSLVLADTWGFSQTLALSLFASVGLGSLPHALSVTLTYDDHYKLARGVIISCIVFTLCQGIMCAIGPWAYALNPNITTPDNTTIYVATNLLPSWLSGVIFCGVFAAIQSSIAGVAITGAAHLSKDLIIDNFMSNVSDDKASNINRIMLIVFAIFAVAVAWFPTDLTQLVINFSLAALASSWYIPVFMGMYWKKATSTGASLSVILGSLTYITLYLVSINPATQGWWSTTMRNIHPFIIAAIVSFLGMYLGSLATPNKKSPLGVYQVWFCDDYDEKYARLDTYK